MILLLFLVPIVLGAPTKSTPSPCCFSHQFSATLNEIGGQTDGAQPSFIDYTARIHYDFDGKKMYLKRDGINAQGQREVYDLLQDYNAKKTYILAGGTCTTANLTGEIQSPCIAPNSTYLGRSTIGSGNQNIVVDNWVTDFPTSSIKYAMTDDGSCTPVLSSVTGTTAGVTQQLTIFFTNITTGVDDASIFTVPSHCN